MKRISDSTKKTALSQRVKFIFILFLSLPVFIQGQVTTWQPPQGFSSDEYYSVKVNGVNVPVYDTPIASYALFDFTDE